MRHKLLILLFALFILHSCTEKEVEPDKSNKKDILSFSFSAEAKGVIDSLKREIRIILPKGTDLTQLTPSITVSDKATVSPQSGEVVDFSKEVIYTVTAEGGSKQTYTVYVDKIKSSENDILSFAFNDFDPALVGVINTEYNSGEVLYHEISIKAPWTGNTKLRPTIMVSEGATVFPESGAEIDFSDWGVEYTVTAEDGTEKTYRVNTLYQIERNCEQSLLLLDLSGNWKVSFAKGGKETPAKEPATITFKDNCTFSISGNRSFIEAADNSMSISFEDSKSYKLYLFQEMRAVNINIAVNWSMIGYTSKDFSHFIDWDYNTFRYENIYYMGPLGIKIVDKNEIHLTTDRWDREENGTLILRRN